MNVRDIHTTQPDDAIITVRTEAGMVEIEVDDRNEMVRVQLDAHRAAVLMAALSQALAIVIKKGGSSERT